MTNRLLLGTKNRGKILELRDLLRDVRGLCLLTLDDCPFSDVDETGETFLDNALLKTRGISAEVGLPVLAEDAGLEVAALGGAPGVRSARFSGEPVPGETAPGEPASYARNNALLLEKLRGESNRRARFVAVTVLLLPNGEVFVTSGTLDGRIAEEPRGEGGFGYDSLFVPNGETRTLAEISAREKNLRSHRSRSTARMACILESLIKEDVLAAP
jgi:XTP/dITP diphosphohydrolase